MANRWVNNGNSDKTLFSGAPKSLQMVTADEIKRHLLLARKAMTNLYSILKSRDITLLTKFHLVKAIIFPVVMYGCQSRTIKKAECQRIGVCENTLWCWRRLLKVLWIVRRSNQSIQKEISPSKRKSVLSVHWKDWCWSWNSNIWPPHAKNWLIGNDLDVGKDWRWEEEGMTENETVGWHHWLDGHEFE